MLGEGSLGCLGNFAEYGRFDTQGRRGAKCKNGNDFIPFSVAKNTANIKKVFMGSVCRGFVL